MDSIEALRRMLRDTEELSVCVSLGDRSMKLNTKALLLALAKTPQATTDKDRKK